MLPRYFPKLHLLGWVCPFTLAVAMTANGFSEEVASSTKTAFASADQELSMFFEKKVRPLLIEQCLECHSHQPGHKIKGGLSLDSRHDWSIGGDSGPAIQPGSPEDSLLIQAITWENLELQMPPKKKLSAGDLQILKTWIQNGAYDPREPVSSLSATQLKPSLDEAKSYWSYQPRQKTAAPALVKNKTWAKTPIDHYILAKLEEKQLIPVADAPPHILARRLSYLLTGLPPSSAKLEQFCRQAEKNRDAAIEQYLDELLASPQFGETWARHWLGVARFAESSGGGRTLLFKDAWRYRDYIIQSFNQDRPFHQLIREQIAGDLLPYQNHEQQARQLIATAFLALGPSIYEEQDKQRLRFDIIDEQLDTIGKAFLGQTISCARCHDHKFDPISQKDYYAMAGIFSSTRTVADYTANVARWVTTPLPLSPEDEKPYLEATRLSQDLTEQIVAARKQLNKLKQKISKLAASAGKPISVKEVPGIVIDDGEAKAQGHWKFSQFTPHYIGKGYVHDENLDKGLKTLTFTPTLPASGRYEVRLAYPPVENRGVNVPVHIFHSGGEERVFINQNNPPEIDDRFTSLGTYEFDKDGPSYVIVSNLGTQGFVSVDAVQFLPESQVQRESVTTDTNVGSIEKKTQASYHHYRDKVQKLESELKKVKEVLNRRPIAMSVREEDTISDTEIRIRGDVHHKAQSIPRGFLSIVSLPSSSANPQASLETASLEIPPQQSGRQQLADWLTHPDHPLTARVYVNRVWAWLFGEGLVRSVDNFGTTGSTPTHPELLDYLADQFIQQGWSTKTLIRQILTSRTWQLSTANQPSDPENLWLSHANRRRLEAEPIRDTMLLISGALDPQLGGPNIDGAQSMASDSGAASNIEYTYHFKDTRRSIYTPAFRNNRLELFELFDFGDINTSQGKRHASTVAPQALFFLNHSFVLEQAELAAKRTMAQLPIELTSDSPLLHQVFIDTLGRPPHQDELEACRQLLEEHQNAAPRWQAWAAIYQSLFGSIDFRYLE